MAEDTFRNIVVAFLLIGLFMVLLGTFISGISGNYGIPNERLQEATQGSLNIEELNDSLGDVDTSAENFRARFESGDVDDVDDPSGVFSVSGDIVGVVTTPFNTLASVGQNILGIPIIFVQVILAILSLGLLLAIWRVLRSGS